MRHSRHPAVPDGARFIVAVNEHNCLWFTPWFTEPIVSVEKVFLGLVARRLCACSRRDEFVGQGRNAECGRRSGMQ
jgi:hypothetical protein